MAKHSTQSARLLVRGFPAEVNVSQEFEIVYSYTPVPDPDWTYTDNEGHKHHYEDAKIGSHYPTLEWVETGTYWCDMCRDQHTDGEYRCKECGEKIEPGTKLPSPYGESFPTGRRVEITVYGDVGKEFEYEVQGDRYRFTRIRVEVERGEPVKVDYIATEKIE